MAFCTKCGGKLAEGAKFCSRCGQAVRAAETPPAADEAFTVTVVRADQWFAINPPVKIVVDRRDEYKVENGSTVRFPVSAGEHTIAFSGSIRNKVVTLRVESNVTLNIKWNRVTGSLEVE
ncbi:MAG: zinc ribbon domain-containing protein [Bacteroides sp.]|nr:zinc ribbon domain-containing protein [Eubacterium sp.]MCM1419322.1 zinc ribbon domain-containing protein [Roseburia sp.]MCM1463150.1 zinc ribbon domain-containing protein [Bacteroides sp.]